MELHERRPLRLKGYDYGADGAYFVTVCAAAKEALFGQICRGDPCGRPPTSPHIRHSPLGELARDTIAYIEHAYSVSIPLFAVMPDHIHLVIVFGTQAANGPGVGATLSEGHTSMGPDVGATLGVAHTVTGNPVDPQPGGTRERATAGIKERATARVAPTLGRVVGGYKSRVYTQWLERCRKESKMAGSIWQRGYYEHIIRNQQDYEAIARYIENNPARWVEKYPYLCT